MSRRCRIDGHGICTSAQIASMLADPEGMRAPAMTQDAEACVPASEHHRVSERLYRGGKSRSSDSGYAGLGLAITRGILELHGHSINFVSRPNQGMTFPSSSWPWSMTAVQRTACRRTRDRHASPSADEGFPRLRQTCDVSEIRRVYLYGTMDSPSSIVTRRPAIESEDA